MRRAFLALLILTCAVPAQAQQTRAPYQPRPPVSVLPSREGPRTVLAAPWALAARQPAGDLHRCNAMCARTRYFCQARNKDDDSCGADWVLCNGSCASAYATTPFGR